MTKGEALALVAASVASYVQAGDIEEVTNLREDDLTAADQVRIVWAIGEVVSRLHRMGAKEKT